MGNNLEKKNQWIFIIEVFMESIFLFRLNFFFNLEPFLFFVFSDLRARPQYADAVSANLRAIKRQPNEAGNKYSELYTYFKLAKKISPRYLPK